MGILERLFGRKKETINPNAKTFKMWEHKGWGNAIHWSDWDKRRVQGHLTPKPQKGDYLLGKMESGKIARFKFVEIEHCSDPTDMFFATLSDIGYVED